jgi:HicB_like antitoxin of bacterial toxin-antitoxin system
LPTYIALLRKDADSDYGVDFPDFPGCITVGSTLEETRTMAAVHEPSSLDAVMADPDNAEALPFLVQVPDRLTKVAHIDIVLSEADLQAIDTLAKKRGKSRSTLLVEAARRMIAESEGHHAA